MAKFSVIVPIYNAQETLPKCIDSILSQTVQDFELILIDDGSSDTSGLICDTYREKDPRIIVIHQKNAGVSSARNCGLNKASGEYIVFIDSDDYIDADYLEQFNTSTADLIISGYQTEGYGIAVPVFHQYTLNLYSTISPECICNLLDKGMLNYACCKVFRLEVIRKHKVIFNSNLSLAEDTLFVLNYLKYCHSIYVVDSMGYHYVNYEKETLSTINYLTTTGINKMEISNELIYKELCSLVGNKAMDVMIRRMGRAYKPHVIQLLSGFDIHYKFIIFLFKQKWFSITARHAKLAYPEEGNKFWLLLKIKSPFLFWLYMKYSNIHRRCRAL